MTSIEPKHRARTLAIAALLCAAACGPGPPVGEASSGAPPAYDQLVAALASCPRGDAPWRAAVNAAAQDGKLDRLAAVARDLADRCRERWEPAWTAGECRYRTNPPDSRLDYEEALRRAHALRDPVGIACAANRSGALAYRSGDLARGEALYREALASATEAARDDLGAFIRNNLAGLLLERGEFAAARDELERAAAGLVALGLDEAARAASFNRAVVFAELGDSVAAREALLALHHDAERSKDEATLRESAITLAKLHLATDDLAPAASWFERARGGDPDVEALALLGLGRVALAQGDLPSALERLHAAVEQARARERLFELIAQTRLAEAEMLSGKHAAAAERLAKTIARSDAKQALESAWAARWTLGRLRVREKRWNDAIPLLAESIRILEAQHRGLDPFGEGLHFLRERAGPYADLAFAIASAPAEPRRPERILAVASSMKARALRRAIGAAARDAAASAPTDLARLRAALREGELLLDYVVGEEHGVVLALSAREATVATLPGRRELAPVLHAFLDSLRPGSRSWDEAAGHELARALLGPVSRAVDEATRIYVVPDREIALLPMAALPLEGGGFLGDRAEVAILPLAGAPPRWDARERAPVLLAGQPSQDAEAARSFPPLPWAAFELSQVRSIWGEEATTLLTGASFDVATLARALSDGRYRTVHLATHAVASTQDPRRCGVIASNGERLGISDILNRVHLPPSSLVVLSACRTGVGEIVPGEGIIGLGWSFLRAGASGIVVSHWTVDDVSAARLMVGFHRKLSEGADPVRALAAASRELASTSTEYRHPMHWAPFVIVLRPE